MSTRPGIDDAGSGRAREEERGRSGLRPDASSAPPGASLPSGTVVAGRYRIGGILGRGGMGHVYRAEQLAVQREVALKVIHAEGETSETRLRFEREALAASRITSPHVVTIHDFGHGENGLLFLAMELLSGESLHHRIARAGALPWAEAVAIALQITRALQAAHAAGVVHRDLKPDNIFLIADDVGTGHVKVLDFGIARIVSGEGGVATAHLTRTDLVVGTPLYMSPEACGRGSITPAADLYSLGVILFEMITGKPPFDEREPVLVMSRHLEARPPRISERRPDLEVPPALDALVDALLRKRPEERPASAVALVGALREVAGERASVSAPPPDGVVRDAALRAEPAVVERLRARLPREGVFATALGGALLVIAVIAAAVMGSASPAPSEVVTVLPREPASRPRAPVSTEAAATIAIRLAVTPASASVRADGIPIAGPVLSLPRDGARHVVEVSAPGHVPRTVELYAEADRELTVTLAPEATPARERARPARSREPSRASNPILREW